MLNAISYVGYFSFSCSHLLNTFIKIVNSIAQFYSEIQFRDKAQEKLLSVKKRSKTDDVILFFFSFP